jgi:hypothetical protein
VTSELKRNKTNLLGNRGQANRTFKTGTDIPEQKTVPFLAPLIDCNFFSELSEREIRDISQRLRSVGDIRAQKFVSLNVSV